MRNIGKGLLETLKTMPPQVYAPLTYEDLRKFINKLTRHKLRDKLGRFTKKVGIKYMGGCDPYDLNDLQTTGCEIYHVDAHGVTSRVSVMSKEGQELLDRFNEQDI